MIHAYGMKVMRLKGYEVMGPYNQLTANLITH